MQTILIINGAEDRVFAIAKALSLQVLCISNRNNLPLSYIDRLVIKDSLSLNKTLNTARKLLHQYPINGVVTFDELSLNAAVAIASNFKFPAAIKNPNIVRNKILMKERLTAHGIPTAKWKKVKTISELKSAAKTIGFPVVIKPPYGFSSILVQRSDSLLDLPRAYKDFRFGMRKFSYGLERIKHGGILVEEFITGTEHSVESIVYQGSVSHISIIDKAPMMEFNFLERGHIVPSQLPESTSSQIKFLVEKAIQVLDIENAVTHAEVFVTKYGPIINEVAARMAGGSIPYLVELTTGYDLVSAALNISLQSKPEANVNKLNNKAACSFSLYAPYSGTLVSIRGIEKARHCPGVLKLNLYQDLGDKIEVPPKDYFSKIARIITVGKCSKEVIQRSKKAISQIDFNIAKS